MSVRFVLRVAMLVAVAGILMPHAQANAQSDERYTGGAPTGRAKAKAGSKA
mgnify:CR=1 FL=1